MSGHRPWQSYHEHRLRMMTKLQYETYKAIQRYEQERIEHQTWLVGVEGWLSRALNDARLGLMPESLAWPVRTIPELNTLAAREYPACAASDDEGLGEFVGMTYDEIKREANVRLLDEYWRLMDESDTEIPPEWKKSDIARRRWAEDLFDRVISQRDDHGRSPDDPHYGHEHE